MKFSIITITLEKTLTNISFILKILTPIYKISISRNPVAILAPKNEIISFNKTFISKLLELNTNNLFVI